MIAAPGVAGLEPEFEILGELGRGGTAVVYLAQERELGRRVAIKVIREHWADDRAVLSRFAREARLAAGLEHPHIVGIHSVRRLPEGAIALVMQFVPGATLKEEILRCGPLPVARVERVLREVGAALACAHAHGIIHRDVKPENIFIDERDGRAVLADFGVARPLVPEAQLTVGGVAMGTPAYMAPEQIDGGPADHRSDVYSLGLVAWEMLSGEAPWEGENLYSVLHKQKTEELASLRQLRPDAPARLRAAVEGAIRKAPDDRWPDVGAMLARLDQRNEPWQARARDAAERVRDALAEVLAPAAAPAADPLAAPGEAAPEVIQETVVFRRADAGTDGPAPEPEVEEEGPAPAGLPTTPAATADTDPGAEDGETPEGDDAQGRGRDGVRKRWPVTQLLTGRLRAAARSAAAALRARTERRLPLTREEGTERSAEAAADEAERRLREWLELRAMMDRRTVEDAGPSSHPRWHLYPDGAADHRALREVAGLDPIAAEVVMQTYGSLDALLRDDAEGVARRTGGEIPVATACGLLDALAAARRGPVATGPAVEAPVA